MKAALAALLICAAGVGAGSLSPFTASFSLPAQATGAIDVSGAGVAVLMMHNPDTLAGEMHWPAGAVATTWSRTDANYRLDGYPDRTYQGYSLSNQDADTTAWARSGAAVSFAPSEGWVAIALAADRLEVVGPEANTSWHPASGGLACAERAFPPHEYWLPALRTFPCVADALLGTMDGVNAALTLRASGIRWIEFMNVGWTCETSPCPAGGGYDTQPLVQAAVEASLVTIRHLALSGEGGELTLANVTGRVATMSVSYRGEIDGTLRLPRGDVAGVPAELGPGGDATVALTGLTRFGELRLQPDNDHAAVMTGDADWTHIRIDEEAGLPVLGSVAMAATGLAALVGAVKLLLGLLTRRTAQDALASPRRRELMERIDAHPGMSFRDIVRETGWISGTVRHHLSVLERTGVVERRPHKGTHRFFPAGSTKDWQQVVVLRNPEARQLWEWLTAYPGVSQKQIIAATARWGWTRSTAQNRLKQLEEAGIVVFNLQGRYKIYSAGPLGAAREEAVQGTPLEAGRADSQSARPSSTP